MSSPEDTVTASIALDPPPAPTLRHLRGIVPAIVTPFETDGTVDTVAMAKLTEYVVAGGVHAIMATGGTGEFPNLNPSERRTAIGAIVSAAAGEVPVIAGTAACSTAETVRLAEDAAAVGADAVISVPPYYFPLPETALEEFFVDLADASPLPLFVYNNPLYTGNPLSPALIVRLLEHPNVIGLKQSASDLGQLVEILYQARVVRGLDRALLTGIDSQFLAAAAVGADGVFSTAAGIVPEAMVALFDAVEREAFTEARKRQLDLQPLNRFLEYDPGYVAPAKEALGMIGLESGAPRAPLPRLSAEEVESLRQALEGLGALTEPH